MSLSRFARRLGALLVTTACLFAFCAAPAVADVKAYNQAASRGDFTAAIAFAEELWPSFDKTLPDTALIAREFAFTGMRAKQPQKAQVFAQWLVSQGAGLPTPDNDSAVANVLLQWSLLGPKPDPAHRKALSDALAAWVNSGRKAGPIIPLAASSALYGWEWDAGEWKDVQRDGAIAARIAAMISGDDAAFLEESIKLNLVAAKFLDDRDVSGFMAMADFHDALMKRMGPIPTGKKDEDHRLYPLGMKARAWMESMMAILRLKPTDLDRERRVGYQRVTDRKSSMVGRCGGTMCLPEPPTPGVTPTCVLSSWDQTPKLTYPPQARYRGIVGTTILKITTDAAGNVTKAEVVAAVPSEVFPEQTVATVLKWKLKPSKQVPQYDPPACTLAGSRLLFVEYEIG